MTMPMPLEEILPIAGIAVDVVLLLLVGGLLLRLSKDPTKVWAEREERLGAIHDALHLLVRQADGQARALDAELAGHTERLRDLLERASVVRATMQVEREPAAAPKPRAIVESDLVEEAPREPSRPAPASDRASLRQQVAALSHTGVDVEEIARRLEVPLADVRVLVALEESARARARAAQAGGQE